MRSRYALVLTAVVLAALQQTEALRGQSQAELRKRFIGTWRLVSIDGIANRTNWGTTPIGLIYYDATGHMAAQIQPDRPRPRWTGTPTPEQAYERTRGYVAYFGTYTVDERAGTVTHHRQGMLDAGDEDFVRKFEFAPGDRLVLMPVGGGNQTVRLTWERIITPTGSIAPAPASVPHLPPRTPRRHRDIQLPPISRAG